MTSIRRALAFSLMEKYALIGLTLVSYVLIARLLTPDEIGMYSVAAALVGIAQVMRDFGIGNYLIQEKELTEAHIRTALGISLVIGGTMFFAFTLGAPLLSDFYGDKRMTLIVRIVALNFLVMPFCTISLSLLRREMKFDRLMGVNFVAAIVGSAVTLLLAFSGFGPQSLAWGAIACNVATGFSAWFAGNTRRLARPSLSEWRRLLSFGGQNTVAGIVTTVAMDINDLVVGKVMGFAPVAILSRAQGLMNLVHRDLIGAVRNVAYPAFARAYREGEAIEPRHVAGVTTITVFAWPIYGFIALYPLEILRLMFGPQWDAAAPLVPVFAAAGAFSATFSLISSVMMAIGRVDLVTRSELLIQPIRVALIVFAAIIFKSLMACAVAYLIAFAIIMPILYRFKSRCMANEWRLLLGGLWKSAQVSCCSLAIPFIAMHVSHSTTTGPIEIWSFAGICGISLATWLAAVLALQHPIVKDPLFKRLVTANFSS